MFTMNGYVIFIVSLSAARSSSASPPPSGAIYNMLNFGMQYFDRKIWNVSPYTCSIGITITIKIIIVTLTMTMYI